MFLTSSLTHGNAYRTLAKDVEKNPLGSTSGVTFIFIID